MVLLTLFFVVLCAGGMYANDYLAQERARIMDLACQIFGNEQKMTRWLKKPLRRFRGRSPLQMMESKNGLKEVEQLLIQMQE